MARSWRARMTARSRAVSTGWRRTGRRRRMNSCRSFSPEGALRFPAARPQEEPEDQAEERQQQDQQGPEQFLAVRGRALKDVDDGPDVADQDQQAQETVVAGVKHRSIPRAVAVGMAGGILRLSGDVRRRCNPFGPILV